MSQLALAALLLIWYPGPAALAGGSSNSLILLTRALRQYSGLKTYRIVEQETVTDPSTSRPFAVRLVASEANGGKYLFEGDGGLGKTVLVSDGTFVWYYRSSQNSYTRIAKPTEDNYRSSPSTLLPDEGSITEARYVLSKLTTLAEPFRSARRLPDANMFIRGQEVECYRIELTNHDLKIPRPYPFTQTVWIEKKSLIVRESVENFVGTYNRPGRLTDTFAAVKTIFYTQVDLGGASSGEDFRFAPPEQAHLVSEFADRAQLQPPEEVQILGRQVSNLDLRSIRGSQTNLESYRGHPILIDLWATWCAPCIEGFSSIAELNRLLSPLGVVVVSIDQSDDAKDAEAFFEKLKYPWPNYHDFGEVSARFGSEAVPRIVLINAEGKVVFDAVAATDDEIKVAIAKLGKEYAGALRR